MEKDNVKKTTTPTTATAKTNPQTGVPAENVRNLPAVIKKAMALPQIIKWVEEQHLIIRHRDRLELYEGQLADFEIARKDEDLEEKYNYSGCQITITDDKRNEFKLKNPALIADMVEFLRGKMIAKRIELEAKIQLPAA